MPLAVTIDMQTGDPIRGPESALVRTAGRELGQYYGLPVQSGIVSFDNRSVLDAEVGWEGMLGGLNAMLSGGAAGIGVGAGPSLEICVLADELTGMLKAMMTGVRVDEDNLALNVIRDVGPGGGTFLGHPHTLMHFREHWQPTLLYRGRYEDWEAAGSKSVRDLVKEKLQHIRATHQPKPVPEAAKTKDRGDCRTREVTGVRGGSGRVSAPSSG